MFQCNTCTNHFHQMSTWCELAGDCHGLDLSSDAFEVHLKCMKSVALSLTCRHLVHVSIFGFPHFQTPIWDVLSRLNIADSEDSPCHGIWIPVRHPQRRTPGRRTLEVCLDMPRKWWSGEILGKCVLSICGVQKMWKGPNKDTMNWITLLSLEIWHAHLNNGGRCDSGIWSYTLHIFYIYQSRQRLGGSLHWCAKLLSRTEGRIKTDWRSETERIEPTRPCLIAWFLY